MNKLDERSKEILWATIKSYIDIKSPVGSRMVTKRFSFSLSPATIRNTMADLNDLGYLTQPHTSAGRVPTDKGYRLYVDALLKDHLSPDNTFLQHLYNRLHSIEKDVNKLVEETSRTLSIFSHYLGVAVPPQADGITLKRIEFIKHKDNKVVCILISEEGIVKNKIITLDEILTTRDIDRITKYLNRELIGLTLKEIRAKIISQMSVEKRVCNRLITNALKMCRKALTWTAEYIYTGGISGTYNLPDFATISQIKKIFKAIEDKHLIARLLDKIADSDGVQVFIGSENVLSEMKDFSIVVSTYNDRRHITCGTIGIIGPTGMDYEQVIPMVEHTARTLSEILSTV